MPKVAAHAQRPRPVQDTSPVIANKRRYTPIPGWNCADCKKSETPVRRHGPEGPRTLCNACGLRRAKRRKVKEAADAAKHAAAGLPAPQPPPSQKTRRRRSPTTTKRTQKPAPVATAQPSQQPHLKENRALQAPPVVRRPDASRKARLQQQLNPSQSNSSFHSGSTPPREARRRPSASQSSAISPEELLQCSLVSTPVSLGPLVSSPILAQQTPSCASLVSAVPQPCTSPVSVSSGRPGTQLLLSPHDHPSLSSAPVSMPLAHPAPRSPVAHALPHSSAKLQSVAEPLCWRQNDVALFDSILEGSPVPAHHMANPLDCGGLLTSPVGVMQDVLGAGPFDYPPSVSADVGVSARGYFDMYGDPAGSLDSILATANESSVLPSVRSAAEDVQMQLKSLHALFADKDLSRAPTSAIGGPPRIDPRDMIQLDKTERGNIVAYA